MRCGHERVPNSGYGIPVCELSTADNGSVNAADNATRLTSEWVTRQDGLSTVRYSECPIKAY